MLRRNYEENSYEFTLGLIWQQGFMSHEPKNDHGIRHVAVPAKIWKFVVYLLLLLASAHGADITTDYVKPSISSKACMATADHIVAKTENLGNDGACMQCDPAHKVR